MNVILLGTAAGGGFPQWNCWCPVCRVARRDPAAAHPRTQSSVAISADGRRWYLLNASPDIRAQVATLPAEEPVGTRHVPVDGVLLTDAELDHTLGLVLLREARRLPLYATARTAQILDEDSHLLPTMRAFGEFPVTTLPLRRAVPILHREGADAGLTVEAFPVPGHAPRFAADAGTGHTVGLLIRHGTAAMAYVPGCGALVPDVLDRLDNAALVLVDGTFWSDDELTALGIGDRTARAMGHQPIAGANGSLAALAGLPGRVVYVHINNTNPILLEHSPERAAVAAAGVTVGDDGMSFSL